MEESVENLELFVGAGRGESEPRIGVELTSGVEHLAGRLSVRSGVVLLFGARE
ncbi:MAG: hypothetical protein K0R38_6481 [Polyangiaceae bacterium]|jgi:hypothetical protein|nr:hypothetical protein [Polyangiaceae bacterium]